MIFNKQIKMFLDIMIFVDEMNNFIEPMAFSSDLRLLALKQAIAHKLGVERQSLSVRLFDGGKPLTQDEMKLEDLGIQSDTILGVSSTQPLRSKQPVPERYPEC